MKTRLRLEGIYDPETISHINEKKINDLGFDFRPKSLNFLQHYKFLEILESSFSPNQKYWLHFDNEHVDIIKKLIADSSEVLGKKGYTKDNLLLEFSDVKTAKEYDEFGLKFAWNYTDMKALEEVIQSENLEYLIINYETIENFYNTNRFHEFVAQFHKKTFKTLHNNKIKLALKADWDSDIFSSLFEFIKFDFCSLPVNNKVESSFRNVDYAAIDKNLNYYLGLEF